VKEVPQSASESSYLSPGLHGRRNLVQDFRDSTQGRNFLFDNGLLLLHLAYERDDRWVIVMKYLVDAAKVIPSCGYIL
jgi:hypothetical protein